MWPLQNKTTLPDPKKAHKDIKLLTSEYSTLSKELKENILCVAFCITGIALSIFLNYMIFNTAANAPTFSSHKYLNEKYAYAFMFMLPPLALLVISVWMSLKSIQEIYTHRTLIKKIFDPKTSEKNQLAQEKLKKIEFIVKNLYRQYKNSPQKEEIRKSLSKIRSEIKRLTISPYRIGEFTHKIMKSDFLD